VLREDYAGSKACAGCHATIADAFEQSPMHRMTRNADTAEIHAPFDGSVFQFKGDSARLEMRGKERFVAIESKQFGSKTYRVTRVIGGHHREDFAGIEVAGVKEGAQIIGSKYEELILPVTWVLPRAGEKGWFRYKGYSVMLKERPGLKAGGVWNQTCIFCHNTVPFLDTVLRPLGGDPKAPHNQGAFVDDLLPPSRRWPLVITDEGGLRDAIAREVEILGGVGHEMPSDVHQTIDLALRITREGFDGRHFVEVGIGCESCHGGAREHVQNVRVRPTFEPRSPLFSVRPPEGLSDEALRVQRINRACARCHQVLFSGYPWTWEGGGRKASPGGSNINSGEARDFLLGGCASAMSCADCHDPHAPDNETKMAALEGEQGDRICTKCHTKYAAKAAVKAHTHHDPAGVGARCLSCHMPKKNMSLDLGLTRYHRIGSPNDARRVALDRPLECALCHADATVASLAATMEKWWVRALDRDALRALYGDLGQNPLLVTVSRGKPHEQATAMAVLGREKVLAAAPAIAKQLTNEIPIVRFYAAAALESIFGERSPVDLHRDEEQITTDAKAWLQRHDLRPAP
jgi:hypothetical protein